ncbi:MAG TPA: RDD family protein [Povalibacter sp.]|nr:RDD family protein [Povalibacter sp.]
MSAEAAAAPMAGVFRRVAAAVYDCLPLFALTVIATFFFLPFLHGRVLVPREVGALAYLYWLVQIVVIGGFYVYFWTRKGQTIGMLPWRLRLQTPEGALIDLRTAVLRISIGLALWLPFFVGYWEIWGHWTNRTARMVAMCASLAPVVLCYLWIWIDRDGLAWHDRLTRTRVIVLPRRKR